MGFNVYSHDALWQTLRVSAAASVPDNYAKMGTAVESDAVATGTTTTSIVATGTNAAVGDILIMTSGDEDGEAREVSAVATGVITLGTALSGTPTAAETFNLIRPVQVGKNGGKIIHIKNTTNQAAFFSFDGTNDHLHLEAGDDLTLDMKSNGIHMARDGYIYVKTDTTAPTSGNITVAIVE